jgi:spore coat protein U-like protein
MKKWTIVFLFLLLGTGRLEAQSCQLGQRNDLQFYQYNSVAVTTTGSVAVTCTSGIAYTIALNAGTTSGATTTSRMMYCGNCTPSTLGYQLFSDASYATNWGNNIGSDTVSGTGTGNAQTFTIYGKIPALEAFYASTNGSNYNDSVTVAIACSKCSRNNISGNNQTFTVHLQQTALGCGISASDLSFGNYTGTALSATTTIQVGCSSNTAYNVGLSAGTANGATVTNRSMILNGGSTLLKYKLLQGSYTGSNWGQTIGTDTVTGSGTGLVQNLTVYGQIPAGQSVTQGTYTDTITATITY